MKRWILAVAVLLIGAAGLVHADYVKIIVNLGVAREKTDVNQMNVGGMGPGGMMPGGGMGPGGMMPGGGMGGFFGDEEEPEFTPLYVVAVIEVNDKSFTHNRQTNIYTLRHKWGTTRLTDRLGDVEVRHIKMPTVQQSYQKELSKLDKEPKPEKLV